MHFKLFLLRCLSPAKFIRHSWITSDEKNVNKPLRDVRHRAQKWNVGKSFTVRRIWNKRKGTWNVLRTFEETHAISAMANSTSRPSSTTGYEKRRLETNHWRQITQGTACSRADICRSGRRFCLFEFNSGCETSNLKRWIHPKKNRHFLYGG